MYHEKAVISYAAICSGDGDKPLLDAWLLDSDRHENVNASKYAKSIRHSTTWFHLDGLSLVLGTIVTSLSNFSKLTWTDDTDMLDVLGSLDELENAKEAILLASIMFKESR